MTFIEYLLRRFVGPPKGGYYLCPFGDHGHRYQVVVNAPLINPTTGKPFPVKARCHRGCGPGPRGCFDEHDLIRHVYPYQKYHERVSLLDELRDEYAADPDAGPDDDHDPGDGLHGTPPSYPRGRDERRVAIAWAVLLEDLRPLGLDTDRGYVMLRELNDAGYLRDTGWFTVRVLDYWAEFFCWSDEVDARHVAECADTECDFICCRAARGLPPLTCEEIAREKAEKQRRLAEEEADHTRLFNEIVRDLRAQNARLPKLVGTRRPANAPSGMASRTRRP